MADKYVAYANGRRIESGDVESVVKMAAKNHVMAGTHDTPPKIEMVSRHVGVHCCAGGQYVGLIYDEVGGNSSIPGTSSNAGLLCRARAIAAAEKMGLPFRE